MNSLVISLGANCGNRERAVSEAMLWLSGLLSEFKASDIYETLPVGHAGSNYINGVVTGETELDVKTFDRLCKEYELNHGRDAESRLKNLVPVDIDIVIANGHIMRPKDYGCGFFRKGYLSIAGCPAVEV
jgi:2-amino-4-hydroxy-6-hydroxymethyldihydropteridine diphosphokinase